MMTRSTIELEARIEALEEALSRSYWGVDLTVECDTPVQFVGVYCLKWGRATEPTIGFRRWSEDEIAALGEA